MSKYSILLLAVVLAGCSASDTPTAATAAVVTSIPSLSAYNLGEPISVGKLTVVPVVAKDLGVVKEEYATLAEAKKNGWIEIVEKPGQETVDTLFVRNIGPKPLLLLGGELLVGGKQDRVVSKDTIIPAGEGREVSVYCVEQGRWSNETTKFRYSGGMVPQSVRDEAHYGSQQEVWNGVAAYNSRAGAAPDADTTVQSGLSSPRVKEAVDSGLQELLAKLKGNDRIVGVVVAINGEVNALEMFGDPKLFQSASESLLRGFLSEAATAGEGTKKLSMQDCVSFITESLNSRKRLVAESKEGNQFGVTSDAVRGVEIADSDYEAKPGQGGGLIHGTYSRKRK